jgi:hypothetical protein
MTSGATGAGEAVAMATLTVANVAKIVSKLKMYPYFDIANYTLMCMMVREDDRPAAGYHYTIWSCICLFPIYIY